MVLLVILAASLAAASCGGQAAAPKQSPPTTAQTRAPASTAQAQPTPASGCPNNSLANCFTYSQMRSFFDTVSPMVAKFYESEYPKLAQPRNVVYIPHGQVRQGPCPGDSESYEYCPANDSINIGQDLLWSFYRIGDAAPVVGLAHEWGHHVQFLQRLPHPRTSAQSVGFENQADCMAGAWTKYAGEQGWLEAAKDLKDIDSLMRAIGSREGGGRDHGTASERTQSFQMGYKTGLKACNSFQASAPIFAEG